MKKSNLIPYSSLYCCEFRRRYFVGGLFNEGILNYPWLLSFLVLTPETQDRKMY